MEEEESAYETREVTPWTLENIQSVWDEYIERMDSPSTQTLLRSVELSLNGDDNVLKVVLTSNRAKDAISRDSILLNLLRGAFKKPALRLETILEEIPEDEIVKPKKMPSTEREKYIHFMELNPLLAEFQKRFELYPPDHDPNKKKGKKK